LKIGIILKFILAILFSFFVLAGCKDQREKQDAITKNTNQTEIFVPAESGQSKVIEIYVSKETKMDIYISNVTDNMPKDEDRSDNEADDAVFRYIQSVSDTRNNNPRIYAVPDIRSVPFFSQFVDISSLSWKKVGCGITGLAMIIEYYKPGTASVNTLLVAGIRDGAYLRGQGWSHAGLIKVSQRYGFSGKAHNLSKKPGFAAFAQLKEDAKNGPVLASVHYKMEPDNPIPHIVVINDIDNDTVYYNDPATIGGGTKIGIADFLKAWKRKFIVIRPKR
jgi:predicted double-glycine peptidase